MLAGEHRAVTGNPRVTRDISVQVNVADGRPVTGNTGTQHIKRPPDIVKKGSAVRLAPGRTDTAYSHPSRGRHTRWGEGVSRLFWEGDINRKANLSPASSPPQVGRWCLSHVLGGERLSCPDLAHAAGENDHLAIQCMNLKYRRHPGVCMP